ncbi:MAG: PQQ-binding-like beta-propeller repeat protein [Planctomycetota bacterium]|nr:PQQ-binding-like beta-propeller repeat protein [Planctomycetota bacterium]
MTTMRLLLACMICASAWSATAAEGSPSGGKDALPLGTPGQVPSPARPTGWRGDWTGRYPGATPVTEWGYWPKSPSWGLRYQLNRPAPNDPGASAADVKSREIMEWLVLGPFAPKDAGKALDEAFLSDEAAAAPSEGEKAGDLAWTKQVFANKDAGVAVNAMSFDRLAREKPNGIVYAHAYLHAKTKGRVAFYVDNFAGAKIWVNGKEVLNNPKRTTNTPGLNYVCYAAGEHWNGELLMFGQAGQKVPVELEQGWNRVLIKTGGGMILHVVEAPDVTYEKKNVVWVAKLPNWSNAMPILVGEKLFVMAEPDELICLDKADGKILWSRRTTFVDATPAEDRAKYPQFKELEALNETLKKTADMGARVELRKKMNGLLKAVDEQEKNANPDFAEIRKLQAVLKDGQAAPEAKEKAVKDIRAVLAAMKCPREVNPLYQVVEPIEARINAADTKADDKAKMQQKFQEYLAKLGPKPRYPFHPSSHVGGIGFACPTPLSDGKQVYVCLNGFGIVGAYDLEGNLKWAQLITDMGDAGAFHNNIPVLCEGKLIVLRGSVLRAFDAETGKVAWTSSDLRQQIGVDIWHGYGTGASYSSSPCLCRIGGENMVFFNSAVVRVRDGKVLAQMHINFGANVRSTPFQKGDAVYLAANFEMARMPMPAEAREGLTLAKAGADKWETGDVSFYSSPVLHDGMLYGMRNDGKIWAYSAMPPREVYVQPTRFDWAGDYDHVGCVASLALGGKHLFAFDNQGTGVVFEPGAAYKELARNRIAHCVERIYNYDPDEFFQTGPVFDGGRFYLRGEQNLYCIGEK